MLPNEPAFADHDRYEADRERSLSRLPRCSICHYPIEDDYYYVIEGENICPECLDENFKRTVDFEDYD